MFLQGQPIEEAVDTTTEDNPQQTPIETACNTQTTWYVFYLTLQFCRFVFASSDQIWHHISYNDSITIDTENQSFQ